LKNYSDPNAQDIRLRKETELKHDAEKNACLIEETHFAPAGRLSRKGLEKQAQEALANPVIRALLEAIQGYLLILNEQRQILAANPELLEALGNEDPDWLIGLRPGESLNCAHFTEGPDGCGTSLKCKSCGAAIALLDCHKQHASTVGECRILIRHGSKNEFRDFQVRATPLESANHRLTIFSILDISSAKRREILEDIFLHDLLNSLGSLEGLTQIQNQPNLQLAAKQFQSITDHLKEEVQYHRSLLEAEKGTLEPANSWIQADEILIELEELLRCHPRISRGPIRFEKFSKGQHYVDKVLILRVLINMSLNAAEASSAGDPVTISYVNDGQSGTFSVHNLGHIPDQVAAHIFERSFSTKSEPGHGFGTYGIKLLGEHYLGGTVSFSTNPRTGTVFKIQLPLNQASAAPSMNVMSDTASNIQPDIAHREPADASQPLHILFIDDTEPLARLGKLFLERNGYRVTTRLDPLEGLALFQKNPESFGLVITDMTMPKLSGLELARRIHSQSPKIPIVLCTGHGDIFQDKELKTAGIRSVISKPLSSIELNRVIHKVRSSPGT
jgi:CheY-like chemotaxis protein/PAS domain-containing protein